jgi:hypothetical protein
MGLQVTSRIRSETRELNVALCCCSPSTAVVMSALPSDLKTHPRTPASKQSRTLLGAHVGNDQDSLARIVSQDLPGRVHAI